MKYLLNIGLTFIVSLIFPVIASSHETDTVHEEVPASVDPMLAIGTVVFVALGGFLLWKFVLNKQQKPPIQSTPLQTQPPKTAQPSNQPVNPEVEK